MSQFLYVSITKRELDKKKLRFLNETTLMSVFLNRMAGDQKVNLLNLDDNTIRTVQSNPFELFMNLESISLANNLISDLTKGKKIPNNFNPSSLITKIFQTFLNPSQK